MALTFVGRMAPHSIKVGVAKLLCRPRIGQAIAYLTDDQIPSYGLRIATSANAVLPETKAAIFWGLYESSELRFLRRYLREDLDVVDLGASIGVAAAHAAARLRLGVRYLAVEANPSLQATLSRNLGSRPGSVVIAKAVDATPGAGPMLTLAMGKSNVASRVHSSTEQNNRTCSVPRLMLSELLRQENVGPYQMLCDIEGSEVGLFLHDRDAFRSCELMIVELHTTQHDGRTYTVADLRDLALSLGFAVVASHGPVYVLTREAPTLATAAGG